MNHLANGGALHNSCKVIFKTTPVNVGIPFIMRVYPKPLKITLPPAVLHPEELFKRLPTGNTRVEAGLTRGAHCSNYTYI